VTINPEKASTRSPRTIVVFVLSAIQCASFILIGAFFSVHPKKHLSRLIIHSQIHQVAGARLMTFILAAAVLINAVFVLLRKRPALIVALVLESVVLLLAIGASQFRPLPAAIQAIIALATIIFVSWEIPAPKVY
jgi:hypothetical protein